MARPIIAVVFIAAITTGTLAPAEIGTFGITPAATLLLPYFEVNPTGEEGVNTTFQVRNANAAPIFAHVMIFTDYSVGTFAFDLYLTGFDVESIDLGAIFRGNAPLDYYDLQLPRDTPADNPPPPLTSEIFADGFESGDVSRWSAVQSRVTTNDLAAYHSGAQAPRTGLCAGVSHGDDLARGYVLINATTMEAGDRFPEDIENYFSDITSDLNVLVGEYRITDPANNFEIGNPLVSVEGSSGQIATPGNPTFYSRYNNASAGDRREPLQTMWGARFLNDGPFTEGTSILYWRDPEEVVQPFPCGSPPDWAPLPQNLLVYFDEEGNPAIPQSPEPAFPYACGRVEVDSEALPAPFDFGWLYVDFNRVPTLAGNHNQAVIAPAFNSSLRFSVTGYGMPFDNLDMTPTDVLGDAK